MRPVEAAPVACPRACSRPGADIRSPKLNGNSPTDIGPSSPRPPGWRGVSTTSASPPSHRRSQQPAGHLAGRMFPSPCRTGTSSVRPGPSSNSTSASRGNRRFLRAMAPSPPISRPPSGPPNLVPKLALAALARSASLFGRAFTDCPATARPTSQAAINSQGRLHFPFVYSYRVSAPCLTRRPSPAACPFSVGMHISPRRPPFVLAQAASSRFAPMVGFHKPQPRCGWISYPFFQVADQRRLP